MNAALAFLNGVGRDRPEASAAADDVWMMNILLANGSPPRPDSAARRCEIRARSVSTVSSANGLIDVKK
jgi:hypothetical protein